MRTHKLSVFVVGVVLAGCVSQIVSLDEHVKGWVGHNIEEMKATMSRPNSYASRIGWKEEIYNLPNGNWIFVEPEPRCFIHWEVNQQGVIVGYKTIGESCK
jgi:hypothetical protein